MIFFCNLVVIFAVVVKTVRCVYLCLHLTGDVRYLGSNFLGFDLSGGVLNVYYNYSK